MYFVIPVPFSVFVFCFCSHWSLVDVPLIFFCPADHVPDWQPRVLLGMVEARSVNVKKTTTVNTFSSPARGHLKKRNRHLFLSSFALVNVVSRDRFGGPVPLQPAAHSPHSRLNVMVLTYGIPPHTYDRANGPCCSRITCLRTGELCNSFLWLLRLQ